MPEPYSRMFPRVSAWNPLSARVDIYKCRISVCLLSLAERICDGLKPLETGRVWADPAAAVCCARQHAVDSTLSSLPATHGRQLPLVAREPPFAAAPLARSHSCEQLSFFFFFFRVTLLLWFADCYDEDAGAGCGAAGSPPLSLLHLKQS